MKLLVLSNGHGEDIIAVRIVEQLLVDRQNLEIYALPIVGRGIAYQQKHIPLIGEVKQMPSGGFIYMDSNQLWRDVQGGLIQLTIKQLRVIRKFAQDSGFILAVGDIVPLLFAWLSGANYAFVGTAQSEYYLRDQKGWLKQTSWLERQSGSVYHPLDRWLMARSRCRAVFPRDKLTTEILQQYAIKAYSLGNPMMDGICHEDISRSDQNSLAILLLPGSRMPEAQRNWQKIIESIPGIITTFPDRSLVLLAAIAPGLELQTFAEHLMTQSWQQESADSIKQYIEDHRAIAFNKQHATLVLTQNAYPECLHKADIAIAMAGTATEQFVGLGKPVITMPGAGPQFTYAFAEAQTRLLGCSVNLVTNPEQVSKTIKAILDNPEQRQRISINGQERMGKSGAAVGIAQHLKEIISKINQNST